MRPPWLGSSPPAGAGSPFSTSSPSNVILTTGRHGGSNGGFGGGLFNSLWAYARPGRWWLAILIICAFQGVLLWHWSNTSAIVFPDQKSASGAAIGGKGGSLNRQRLGDAAAAAAAASAFRRHLIIESQEQTQDVSNLRSLSYNPTTASLSAAALEELVRKVAENVSQRIESHEAVLVNLGIKLLNREQQLSKIDKHFLDAALLNRTLVFPSHGPGVDYDYERLLDMEAPRRCFGNQTFLTLDEYAAIQEAKVGTVGCARVGSGEKPGRGLQDAAVLVSEWHAGVPITPGPECPEDFRTAAEVVVSSRVVFPSHGPGVDYDYERLLDMEAPRRCFGNQTFLTLDEYAAIQEAKNPKRRKSAPVMVVDVFICHVHHYQTERECGYIRQRYQQLHIHFAKTVIPEKRTPSPWFKYPSKEFISLFNYDDSVIAFGNMFGVSGQDLRFHHARPLVVLPGCKYYIMPSPMVRQAAAGFINSYIGSSTSSSDNSNAGGDAAGGGVRAAGDGGAGGTGGGGFMALHMRRGDFYQHCVNMKGHSKFACYHPIRQLAACVARRLDENPGVRAIYLSTNGDDDEVRMFREFLAFERARPRKYVVNGTTEDGRVGSVVRVRGGRSGLFSSEPVPVVRMSIKSLETQPWAEPLVQAGAHNDSVVISYVEKAISEGEGEAAGEAVGGATVEEGEEAEAEGEEAYADSGWRATVEKVKVATIYILIHLAGVAGSAEGEEAEAEAGEGELAGGDRGGVEAEVAEAGEGARFWAGGMRTVRGMGEGLVVSGGEGKEQAEEAGRASERGSVTGEAEGEGEAEVGRGALRGGRRASSGWGEAATGITAISCTPTRQLLTWR
ncbi:unnamed protein product [Closterium sp. NIES-65]|nr:unnamed protein product [Closterium sp. NIES-65]